MASTTESSAIVRFIHGAQPPILERQHGIETEVVANPYFVPAGGERGLDRPARRSYAPLLVVAVGGLAAAGLILYMYGRSGEAARAEAMGPRAAPAIVAEPIPAPVVAPGPVDPEPIVIAVPSTKDEPEDSDPQDAEPEVADLAEPVDSIETPAAVPRKGAPRAKARPRAEAPVLPASKGVLMIASKPPCHIIINGKETGLTTPQPMIRLRTGRHQVTLVNQEYDIRASVPVVIEAGKSVRIVKDLTDRMNPRVP